MNTLVLRPKAAESFLETKIRITRCEKRRFYPVLAKIRLEDLDKPKILVKKNVKNHSYHQFYPVLTKIRLTESGLTEVYCSSMIGCEV